MKKIIQLGLFVATTMLFITGCSKHPETITLEIAEVSKNNLSVKTTAYVLSDEIKSVASKIEKIKDGKDNFYTLVKSDVTPSFPMSNEHTEQYYTILAEAKKTFDQLPKQAKEEQTAKENVVQAEITALQLTLSGYNSQQSQIDQFTKREVETLEALKKEALVLESKKEESRLAIVQKINQYIVDNRVPINKLDETNSTPFDWDITDPYKGKCSQHKNRYYTEGTSSLSACLFFTIDYLLKRSEHVEGFAQVIKDNIAPYIAADWALKMSVGDKFGVYKKIKDAQASLEQGKIIAQNQTDINIRQLERDVSSISRKMEYKNKELTNLREHPITVEGLLDNNTDLTALSVQLKGILNDIVDQEFEIAVQDEVILGKSEFEGVTGKLATTNGEMLIMAVELGSGYRSNVGAIFTDLNQQWGETVVISEKNSVASQISSDGFRSDKEVIEVAVKLLQKYNKQYQKVGTS